MQPTECECVWCGLHDICDNDDDRFFACGTILAMRSGVWNQSTGCQEIMASRDSILATDNRIRRAMALVEKSTRFHVVNQLIQILEGESDGRAE